MFNGLDYLVYSPHKTSTQSLLATLNLNNIISSHIHNLSNLILNKKLFTELEEINIGSDKYTGWGDNHTKESDFKTLKQTVISHLQQYKNIYNKQLSIITVVRNPKQRLISSFFQTYHTDEIIYLGKNDINTTITTLNADELYSLYCNDIQNNCLPGCIESIDEMSLIFDYDIINSLENFKTHYYFENNLIKLYVLNFEDLISINSLEYLNNIFNTNLVIKGEENLTTNKSYKDKYNIVKSMITDDINNIIYNRYNMFYFTAFSSN